MNLLDILTEKFQNSELASYDLVALVSIWAKRSRTQAKALIDSGAVKYVDGEWMPFKDYTTVNLFDGDLIKIGKRKPIKLEGFNKPLTFTVE